MKAAKAQRQLGSLTKPIRYIVRAVCSLHIHLLLEKVSRKLEKLKKEMPALSIEGGNVQRLFGHHLPEPGVLIFTLAQAQGVGNIPTAILWPPLVKGGVRDSVLAAQVTARMPDSAWRKIPNLRSHAPAFLVVGLPHSC